MVWLMASAGSAGPMFYVLLGLVLMIVGTTVATDFRGLGMKYTSFGRRERDPLDQEPPRLELRYRLQFWASAVIGFVLFLAGLSRF